MKIKYLTKEQTIAAVKSIKNGQYCRITYSSELPLKAADKKAGWKINKITETTGRLGVDYDNIGSVKERREARTEPVKEITNNYTWIVDNKIAHNSKTGGDYLRITTTKNSNTMKKYLITEPGGVEREVEDLDAALKGRVIDSYWKPKEASEVRNIKIEHIIKVSDYGKAIAW